MNSHHMNAFLNHNLVDNDRKRRRMDTDLLDERDRQRRRVGAVYNPEIHRQILLNACFACVCTRRWPRKSLFNAAYVLDVITSRNQIRAASTERLGIAATVIGGKLANDFTDATTDAGKMARLFARFTNIDTLRLAQAELRCLLELDFRLQFNHPYDLFDRLRAHLSISCENIRDFTRFLIDCCTMDERSIGASPSRIVAASFLLASDILNKPWTRQTSRLTGFVPDELKEDVNHLLDFIRNRIHPHTNEVYQYWSRDNRKNTVIIDGKVVLVKDEIVGKPRRKNARPIPILNPSHYIVNWAQTHTHSL